MVIVCRIAGFGCFIFLLTLITALISQVLKSYIMATLVSVIEDIINEALARTLPIAFKLVRNVYISWRFTAES